ncbi:hypothetical protein Tco_0332418 [Tanacetum coccineum]
MLNTSNGGSKAKLQTSGLKDITDKDITDEDCIHESNYAMSKGKYTRQRGKERCHMEADHVLVKDQSILDSLTCLHLHLAIAACICSLHLHLAFASCICILHLQSKHLQLVLHLRVANACLHLHHAFACCIVACICKQAFASLHLHLAFACCIGNMHLQLAFASYVYRLHLQQEFAFSFAAFALLCNKNLLCCKLLQQPFARSICFAASYCNKH